MLTVQLIAEQGRYMVYADDGSSDAATQTSGGASGGALKTRDFNALQIRESDSFDKSLADHCRGPPRRVDCQERVLGKSSSRAVF